MSARKQDRNPSGRTVNWRILYFVVAAFLAIQIFLYWLLTRAFV